MTNLSPFLRSALVVMLVSGCTQRGPATPKPEAKPEAKPSNRSLYTFTAEINPAAGTMRFVDEFSSTALGLTPFAPTYDGVNDSGPEGTIEIYTTNTRNDTACPGAPMDAFCGDVTINSFVTSRALENVYAEVQSIMPPTGHEGRNSDPAAFGLSDALGLWSYGDLAPAAYPAPSGNMRTWIFGSTGVPYVVRGRIMEGPSSGTLMVSFSNGGGRVQTSNHKLRVSIQGATPIAQSETTMYKLSIGLGDKR